MVDFVPLEHLSAGQFARVVRVEGLPGQVHRLAEFGLRGGAPIQMFRPGNPCIVRLAGSKVCLRADARVQITVKPTGSICRGAASCRCERRSGIR